MTWMSGSDLVRDVSLLAPHEQSPWRTLRREGIKGGEMSAAIEEFGMRFLLGTTYSDRTTPDDMGYHGGGIVEVADENSFSGTDDDAGRFESYLKPMGAKVTLLGGMILRIDKDGVVRTGGNAGFTANTNGFVEIDYAIRASVHRSGRASWDARWVITLVTAGDLEGAARMGKDANINILHIGAVDRQRHLIFGFTGRATGVTADTFIVVNDFRPFAWRRFGVR